MTQNHLRRNSLTKVRKNGAFMPVKQKTELFSKVTNRHYISVAYITYYRIKFMSRGSGENFALFSWGIRAKVERSAGRRLHPTATPMRDLDFHQ